MSFLPPLPVIGSGRDHGMATLNRIIDRVPRDKRDDVNPIIGIEAMLLAYSHALHNAGVGGVPNITYQNLDSSRDNPFLKANESQLATQLVQVSSVGLLDRKSMKKGLSELFLGKKGYEQVFEEQLAGNKKAVHYLLGFEVQTL